METKSKTQGKDTAHSPLPWRQDGHFVLDANDNLVPIANNTKEYLDLHPLIVRRVNQGPAFDAMAETLESVEPLLAWLNGENVSKPMGSINVALSNIRAALALAKEASK